MPNSEATEPLISLEEAARYLNVKRATLYAWRNRGSGPRSYTVGSLAKYRMSEIEAWLQQRATRERR